MQHPNLCLLRDFFILLFEDVERLLHFIEKCREGHGTLVFIVECVANSFCRGDSPTGIALSAIVLAEGIHVFTPALTPGEWFDPLLGGLRLQKALDELMHFASVGLKDVTA